MKLKEREMNIEQKIAAEKQLRLDASQQRLQIKKIQLKNKEDQVEFLKQEILKFRDHPGFLDKVNY